LTVMLFGYLRPTTGIVGAAEVVGLLVAAFALYALASLRETFDIDLDYVERDVADTKAAKQAAE